MKKKSRIHFSNNDLFCYIISNSLFISKEIMCDKLRREKRKHMHVFLVFDDSGESIKAYASLSNILKKSIFNIDEHNILEVETVDVGDSIFSFNEHNILKISEEKCKEDSQYNVLYNAVTYKENQRI